jgi:hypothetical protein
VLEGPPAEPVTPVVFPDPPEGRDPSQGGPPEKQP